MGEREYTQILIYAWVSATINTGELAPHSLGTKQSQSMWLVNSRQTARQIYKLQQSRLCMHMWGKSDFNATFVTLLSFATLLQCTSHPNKYYMYVDPSKQWSADWVYFAHLFTKPSKTMWEGRVVRQESESSVEHQKWNGQGQTFFWAGQKGY